MVYGVYARLSGTGKEIQDNIKGASVAHVFRFNPEAGGNKDSPVLLTFADGVMPKRVYVVSMAYRVREYVKALLQRYKCQRSTAVRNVVKIMKV